jgi:hypothetical protein
MEVPGRLVWVILEPTFEGLTADQDPPSAMLRIWREEGSMGLIWRKEEGGSRVLVPPGPLSVDGWAPGYERTKVDVVVPDGVVQWTCRELSLPRAKAGKVYDEGSGK